MRSRIPFMLAAVVNLIAGIWAGLVRIGWDLPVSSLAVHHGALMVGGFLTTLIILEKVIPLKKKLAYAIPVISALSLFIAVPGYYHIGLYFLLAGSIGLFIIHAWYIYMYPHELTMLLMLIGACCLITGNAMLIHSKFYPAAFPWWMGFLLFTITAERLELSKFLPVTKSVKILLLSFMALFVAGLIIPFHSFGKYASGLSMILISIWMMRHDVMRIGVKKKDLTKFSAVALLLANMWLLVDGLLLMLPSDSAYSYDILVHVFFIGYTLSMIFAHGPIILPGVLGFSAKPFHPVLYVWLGLLQLSLLLRLIADTLIEADWRALSGILSTAAILLYFATLAFLVIRQQRNAKVR